MTYMWPGVHQNYGQFLSCKSESEDKWKLIYIIYCIHCIIQHPTHTHTQRESSQNFSDANGLLSLSLCCLTSPRLKPMTNGLQSSVRTATRHVRTDKIIMVKMRDVLAKTGLSPHRGHVGSAVLFRWLRSFNRKLKMHFANAMQIFGVSYSIYSIREQLPVSSESFLWRAKQWHYSPRRNTLMTAHLRIKGCLGSLEKLWQ